MAQFPSFLPLASLTGINGFKLSGATKDDRAGISVASAGDINGDGFADLIVGADLNGTNSGAAYVVFGHDGIFAANIDLASLNSLSGFRISGVADGDLAGKSVASAGDVNGDRFGDLIVGAPTAAGEAAGSGAAYVVFGKPAGFGANFDLSSPPSTAATVSGSAGFSMATTLDTPSLQRAM